jgi:SNF2 family DNA or RNA helicase
VRRLELQDLAIREAICAKHGRVPLEIQAYLRTRPMAHQVRGMNFASRLLAADVPGAALFMEQGTGKTLCAIGLANWLYVEGKIAWVLVVAPNSLKGTWGHPVDGEIAKHSDAPAAVRILREPRARRVGVLERCLARTHMIGLQWVITNYEQFAVDYRRNRDYRTFAGLAGSQPGLLVLDESSMVKSPQALRTRTVRDLAARFPYTLLLTGTPVTRSPLDVWAQFQCIEPGMLGYKTYLAFERYYATHERQVFHGRPVRVVLGYRNLHHLEERVARYSYRVRAADCLDLPETVTQRVAVELSSAQRRAIRELKREMLAQMDDGTLVDGRNILTRYLRMSEIAGGYVHTMDDAGQPTGDVVAFDPNPKKEALLDYLDTVLEDPEHKAVVFAQFRAEIEGIVASAEARDWRPVPFHGGVPEVERDEGRRRFGSDPASRVMVVQYATGSRGLNLAAANHCVLYSLTFDLELFLQALKRVHRLGQARTVTYGYLLAEGSLDRIILDALQGKKSLADIVTGDAATERKRLAAL